MKRAWPLPAGAGVTGGHTASPGSVQGMRSASGTQGHGGWSDDSLGGYASFRWLHAGGSCRRSSGLVFQVRKQVMGVALGPVRGRAASELGLKLCSQVTSGSLLGRAGMRGKQRGSC